MQTEVVGAEGMMTGEAAATVTLMTTTAGSPGAAMRGTGMTMNGTAAGMTGGTRVDLDLGISIGLTTAVARITGNHVPGTSVSVADHLVVRGTRPRNGDLTAQAK